MANEIPDNPEILLGRRNAAAALTAEGFPIAESTLATMASRGNGPEYCTFGRTVLYRWGDLLAWAESRMSKPHRSTSERDNRKAAQ
jgi:hypothetical protein